MKFGFVYPMSDPNKAVEWAKVAEAAGWDGFFVADAVWGMDAWVTLTAVAVQTERIRVGTMLTPVAWARPWKLASETSTLDQLSNGRVILSVALGANDAGPADFGLVLDRKIKAELVDEGLEIVTGLWPGKPIGYNGKHYQIKPTAFPPPSPTIQQPRIPIWVVGAWPYPKSLARAAKYDGWLVAKIVEGQAWPVEVTPDDLREMVAAMLARRDGKPMDVIIEGVTKNAKDTKRVKAIEEAGATWWVESMWGKSEAAILKRLKQGPAR
jgi:alkanesulfonate monooxygenase SsuD/methylene tetrahydromethanopterin reductase-like flavin-dependent oxidoreductase (luciferase family)